MMGPVDTELDWAKKGPTGIMMWASRARARRPPSASSRAGSRRHKKKPMLVAADIYRPAAVEQLKTLGRQLDMPVFSIEGRVAVANLARRRRGAPRDLATSSSSTPPAASRSTSR